MMDGWTRIKLYDKGWFQFPNCKFPFLSNNKRICPIVVATNLYSFLECEIIKLDLLPIYIIRLLSRRMPHFWHNLLTSPDHLVSVRVDGFRVAQYFCLCWLCSFILVFVFVVVFAMPLSICYTITSLIIPLVFFAFIFYITK